MDSSDRFKDAYKSRLERIFNRVKNIQNLSKEETKMKIMDMDKTLQDLNKNIKKQKEENKNKSSYFTDKVGQLRSVVEQQQEQTQNFQENLVQFLQNSQNKIQETFLTAKNQRDEIDEKLVGKLNNSIDLMQNEIQKNLINNEIEGNQEMIRILDKEIPQLQYDLANENQQRRNLEKKILNQFLDQIEELNTQVQEEKREREISEEEILKGIETVSNEIEMKLKQQSKDRERNENVILELIEKVVERLKNDVNCQVQIKQFYQILQQLKWQSKKVDSNIPKKMKIHENKYCINSIFKRQKFYTQMERQLRKKKSERIRLRNWILVFLKLKREKEIKNFKGNLISIRKYENLSFRSIVDQIILLFFNNKEKEFTLEVISLSITQMQIKEKYMIQLTYQPHLNQQQKLQKGFINGMVFTYVQNLYEIFQYSPNQKKSIQMIDHLEVWGQVTFLYLKVNKKYNKIN